jgi:3-hydroxyisobutyrate dehydrogenase/glyoxylate/succinic semialdehyde reductase
MKIGFIGLGIMGSRMAANLQRHGYDLVVFNRTRAKAHPLIDNGATFAESPAKVADQVDVLLTMLAHPDAVEQAAVGRNGFLSHLKPNALWVDYSSVNPLFSKKMAAAAAARQIHFVDAPVTGYLKRGSNHQFLSGMAKSYDRPMAVNRRARIGLSV